MNEPDIKRHRVHDSNLYKISVIDKSMETESRLAVSRDCGEREGCGKTA